MGHLPASALTRVQAPTETPPVMPDDPRAAHFVGGFEGAIKVIEDDLQAVTQYGTGTDINNQTAIMTYVIRRLRDQMVRRAGDYIAGLNVSAAPPPEVELPPSA